MEDAPPQPMVVDGHPSRDGKASAAATFADTTAGNKDMMEELEEEREMEVGNPEFSKFMQGFWDLASVDVAVRYTYIATSCSLIPFLIIHSSN